MSSTEPLKILLVASFRDRDDALHYYFPARKLLNGLVRLGHCAYTLDDRETARASNPFGSRKWGETSVNRKFLRICDHFRPDVILLYHADTLRRETLSRLRRQHPHTPVGFISVDSIQGKGSRDRLRGMDDLLDAFFVTTGDRRIRRVAPSAGCAAFIPNPVDSSIETKRAWARSDCDWDVFFAGGTYSSANDRQTTARAVRDRVDGLRCCYPGMDGRPKVYGSDFIELLGTSRMGLNLSWGEPFYLYSSDRISMYLGHGLLTFIDSRTGYGDVFSDESIVIYDHVDDLIDKVRFFHHNDSERRRVARNGWEQAHRTMSVTEVASYMLDVLLHGRPTRQYGWPDVRYPQLKAA